MPAPATSLLFSRPKSWRSFLWPQLPTPLIVDIRLFVSLFNLSPHAYSLCNWKNPTLFTNTTNSSLFSYHVYKPQIVKTKTRKGKKNINIIVKVGKCRQPTDNDTIYYLCIDFKSKMHKNSQINGARGKETETEKGNEQSSQRGPACCKMTNAKVYEKENMNIYIYTHILHDKYRGASFKWQPAQ